MSFFIQSKVTMADGSLKNIEDIQVGDQVLDYKLQPQRVLGINVKHLHENVELFDINEKLEIHCITFPLLGADGKFYCDLTQRSNDPIHHMFVRENNLMRRAYSVTPVSMLRQIQNGVVLKTKTGTETVTSIEQATHPTTFDERTLYMLHVSGNGSYFINDFCVIGNFNIDWDYENDRAFTDPVTVIINEDEPHTIRHGVVFKGTFQRVLNYDVDNPPHPYWNDDIGLWQYPPPR